MPTVLPRHHGPTCALLLLAAGCSDSVMPKAPVDHLMITAGNEQAGLILDTLPHHLAVRVVNDAGEPLAGVPVAWTATDASAHVVPVGHETTSDGIARAIAILGFGIGAQRFTASVAGLDEGAVFTIQADTRPGLKAVSLMRGTANHMCALDAEGRAWCWGNNNQGQLGSGTRDSYPWEPLQIPQPVQTDQRFQRLWGWGSGTCGLTTSSELWCWGSGANLFGNGAFPRNTLPAQAASGMRLRDFDVDLVIACGVTLDHAAYCWGSGPMGDGSPAQQTLEPVRVAGDRRWLEISVEDQRVCAVDIEYVVHCWTSDATTSTIAGLGNTVAYAPMRVPGAPPMTGLSVGWALAPAGQCALSASGGGLLLCWGAAANRDPRLVSHRLGGNSAVAVEMHAMTATALSSDGSLWIWGRPPYCCDGWIADAPVPLEPAGPWLDVSVADGVFAISAADSVVYRWPRFPGFGPPVGVLPSPVPAPAP